MYIHIYTYTQRERHTYKYTRTHNLSEHLVFSKQINIETASCMPAVTGCVGMVKMWEEMQDFNCTQVLLIYKGSYNPTTLMSLIDRGNSIFPLVLQLLDESPNET